MLNEFGAGLNNIERKKANCMMCLKHSSIGKNAEQKNSFSKSWIRFITIHVKEIS